MKPTVRSTGAKESVLITFLSLEQNTQYPQLKGGDIYLSHGLTWVGSIFDWLQGKNDVVEERHSTHGSQEAEGEEGEARDKNIPFYAMHH